MQLADRNGKHDAADLSKEGAAAGNIAYVNIDTLETKYEYLKNKQEEFENRKQKAISELESSQKKLQQDYMAIQRKMQAGTISNAELQAADKRLTQMSQSLQTREASLTEQFMKEQEDFNRNLKKRLDDFLSEYNEGKNYDYILSYSGGINSILLANPSLEITTDVVKGMNEEYADEGDDDKEDDTEKTENK